MSDQRQPNGPVERALGKFSNEDLPLAVREAVARIVDSYRRFGFRQGQELAVEEVRKFLREGIPQGIERLLSLVAQEIAQDAAKAEAEAGAGAEAKPSNKEPPTINPTG